MNGKFWSLAAILAMGTACLDDKEEEEDILNLYNMIIPYKTYGICFVQLNKYLIKKNLFLKIKQI